MRLLIICACILSIAVTKSSAQVFLKTEYFGTSGYQVTEGDSSQQIGDSKGSAQVFQGGINIPLSVKLNENSRPTMWSLSAGGAYVRLHNQNFTQPLVIDKMLNLGININYLRPINERWSLKAAVGGGIFMPGTNLSRGSFKNVLASGNLIFIRHLRPNLDIGGGIAINNSFGFPMIFPAFHLNWTTSGRYALRVSLENGLEVSAAYKINDNLKLSLVGEINGQMALLEQNDKDKMFTHQYVVLGLRPEIKLGKKVSVPITFGLNASRTAQISDRSLKTIFQDKGYAFRGSIYASGGLLVAF